MKSNKILVIGDGCKDIFQYGKCERLSPEAPVPVFKPTKTTSNGGMAVNVYNNLLALGVDCDIVTDSGITKTRMVDEVSNQMLLRIDEHDQIFLSPSGYESLMAINYSKYDAIVISDYDKGFLSKELIKYIADVHPLVFMDSKKVLGDWCANIDFIKINQKEFERNHDYLLYNYIGLPAANLIVTKGKNVLSWNSSE